LVVVPVGRFDYQGVYNRIWLKHETFFTPTLAFSLGPSAPDLHTDFPHSRSDGTVKATPGGPVIGVGEGLDHRAALRARHAEAPAEPFYLIRLRENDREILSPDISKGKHYYDHHHSTQTP
jgi:hypothetical protein